MQSIRDLWPIRDQLYTRMRSSNDRLDGITMPTMVLAQRFGGSVAVGEVRVSWVLVEKRVEDE